MIIWRNVAFAMLGSTWVHGLGAAILYRFGEDAIGGFCIGAAIVSGLLTFGCAIAATEQDKKRLDAMSIEITRLRNKLNAREIE